MNRSLLIACLGWMACIGAYAAPHEWTSGWAMGTSEYAVDDGIGNELVIACPDDENRYISASAAIHGRTYSSENEQGFDVIVDGKNYNNPFNTDCRACSDIFKAEFWPALRKANRLQLSANGQTVNLPTKNLQAALPALGDQQNSCWTAW